MIDAFGEARFRKAERKPGAASYAVGMPSFAPIYALNAGLRYLEKIGIDNIAYHADKLIREVHDGLMDLGLFVMAPFNPTCCSGIISFQHADAESLRQALRAEDVHVMRGEGRIRIAIHGYNTEDDVTRLLYTLKKVLNRAL
jgi:selenocysteine lyase/cysteine desulfurase